MEDKTERESLARSHLPYRAEYCKTSRASCKKCGGFMQEDTLKLANLVRSRFHDGYDSHFYHVDCFFRVKRPSSIAEIRHFETLRYEDQRMLEEAVETKGRSILGASNEENSRNRNKDSVNYEDFTVEYARSNRSKCVLCDQKIEKESVRLGKMDFEADNPWGSGPITRWFHVECFQKSIQQLEFYGELKKITNFDYLEDEDQRMLMKKIKPLKRKQEKGSRDLKPDAKKAKKSDEINKVAGETQEERQLRTQSDRFFSLRSIVATMKRKDLELMMSHMNQKYNYKNISILIDMATDVLLFGPIQECPECKQSCGMQLRGSCYICTNSSEWAPCTYETREPKRGVPDIPEELLEKYEFFNEGYKFCPGKRIFSSKFIKAVEQKEAEDNNTVVDDAPLDGLTLGVISWKALSNKKADIQKKVTMLGGKLTTALDRSIFVILTSEKELESDTQKIEVAKDLNVPFATDEFLFNIVSKEDVIKQLSMSIIKKWDGDLNDRYARMNVNQLKENLKSRAKSTVAKSIYKSSRTPKSQTLVVKDGTAVDPDSNLAEVCRVFRKGPSVYSVVLNIIDVTRDKNSFYKMQVIEHETRKEYYLFRSWGRIGCEVGGTSCREMDSINEAVETFEKLFEEKTGNPFENLLNGKFERIHGLYFPIEVDYSDPNTQKEVKLEYDKNSKLDKPVQDLVCFIFDIQRMHKAMKRFELDAEKMPLGKLSEKHILKAMEILKELQEALEVKPPKKPSKRQLVALTNKFYSFIPQSFGDGQVELISSLNQVDEKNQMLTELQEIELAYRMCSNVEQDAKGIAVDQYYTKLECTISVLNREDKMFRLITDYVAKTHAITHNNYKMKIQDIFEAHRDAEMKRFIKHKDNNRYLLWHGSRVTNFAGILSQGLKVAPPQAPSTGYMFGKGIYFADMSSKAANYCMADPSNSNGLLLLCDVALGKMYDLLQSDENMPKGLPDDCNSVRGVGKNTTDPKTHVKLENDVIVPIGKQIPKPNVKSQLLYNEYVVYDESQIMLRYIVRVEFDFKR